MDFDNSVLRDFEEEIWPPYLGFEGVVDHINFAGFFQAWVEVVLVHTPYKASHMKDMGVTALSLALEHHASIFELMKVGKSGSAAALTRPLFEAFARGMWLIKIDNPQKLKAFEEGMETSDPEKLIKDCMRVDGEKKYSDLLSSWLLSKKALHSFVHSKFEAILRMSNDYHPEAEELVSMLRFSTGVAVNAVLELVDFVKLNHPPELALDESRNIADIERQAWLFHQKLMLSESVGTKALRIQLTG